MPRARRLERASLAALSDSETEEIAPSNSNGVDLARRTPEVHLNSSAERISSERNVYGSNHVNMRNISTKAFQSSTTESSSSIHANNATPLGISTFYQRNFSPNSPQIDFCTSAVQCSIFHRFRWVIWKYIYLKIIMSVNFDVWLLSRLRRNYKAMFIFLLPLLIYLIFALLSKDTIGSSLASVPSSIYSLLSVPYSKSLEILEQEETGHSCFAFKALFSYFSIIQGFFTNLIFKPEASTSFSTGTKPQSFDSIHKWSEDSQKFKSIAIEVFEERLNELTKKIEVSYTQVANDQKVKATQQLQSEISDLQLQFESLSGVIKLLEKDILKVEKSASSKALNTLSAEHSLLFNSLNTKLKNFEAKLESLGALKKCCDEKWTQSDFTATIEKHLVTAFKNIVAGDKKSDSSYRFFNDWLNSKYIDSNKLSIEINAALDKMKSRQSADSKLDANSLEVIKGIVQHHIASLKADLTAKSRGIKTSGYSISDEDMQRIVREAIMLYDADKTGLVDYALESGGGSVLGTRCSESYVEKNGKFTIFGLPLWSDQNSPRTAIQPDMHPGKCWAFKGSQGFLVIQLSYMIYPTGFTLEHIPVSLSPTGSIDSAPKEFSVWVLSSESDNEGFLLGNYTYDQNGEPLQYFPIQNLAKDPSLFVELKIHSNHGNLDYTCIYRFRVHGTRSEMK